MRTSRLAMSTVLAAGLVGLAGAPALASGASDPFDCEDFDSRVEAQAKYESDTTDPSGLDADDDGLACETYDYSDEGPDDPAPTPTSTTTGGGSRTGGSGGGTTDGGDMATPDGGVDAGAGGAAGDVSGLLATGGLLLAAGASGLVLLRRRPTA